MTSRQQSILSVVLLTPTLVAFGLLVFQSLPSNLVLQPPSPLGPPLRESERVYLYTSQIQKRITYKPFTEGRVTITNLHVDLWAFDAISAEPIFRQRLSSDRDGSPLGRSVLGIQGVALWLLTPAGPVATSLATGEIIRLPPPALLPILPPSPDSFRTPDSTLGDDYIAPALLSVNSQPIPLRDPDSFLIVHHDRAGVGSYLQLTRISGPGRHVLWQTTLPIATIQSVLPGQTSLVLFGVTPANRPPQELLVAVDLAAGIVRSYNLDTVGIHPKPTPASLP